MKTGLDFWRRDAWPTTSLQKELERVFDTFGREWPTSPNSKEMIYTPACNVEETANQYLFSFDLPGVPKDNVKIEINENQLTVSGHRTEEHKEDKKNQHLYERFEGRFYRSFTLPLTIDTERTEADFHNGVLKITVPKIEAAKPKQIKIGEGKKVF